MTTNQTIDGVPLLPCPFCGGEPYGTHDHYVHDDLSPMPCVECRSCSAHLKADDWNRRVQQGSPTTSDWERGLEDADGNELVTVRADEYARLKAAQPQGEPVAWIKPDVAKTLTKDECCYAFGSQNPKGTLIPLYAGRTEDQ